jgi:hypothetical protein
MAKKATPTRTIGPLHLEDLEPHRFEDLVRQLAYDFQNWLKLEATGRSGADDGFDARGLEIIVSADERDDEDEGPITREWLIQSKREKEIGPKKLVSYVEAMPEGLYGVVLAAACDFSKTARDKYYTACRERGYSEAHLWGKAEIEDSLFQPKNDYLLFAYTGISLQSRRRSVRSEVRATLAAKRKVKRALENPNSHVFIVRNAAGSEYPSEAPYAHNKPPSWFTAVEGELTHAGLEIDYRTYHAYVADDGEGWDVANGVGLHRRVTHFGQLADEKADPRSQEVEDFWGKLPEANRAWLRVRGLIPYERIVAVDDLGDDLFDGPQLYVEYVSDSPLDGAYGLLQTLSGYGGGSYPPLETRIVFFPPHLRREIG